MIFKSFAFSKIVINSFKRKLLIKMVFSQAGDVSAAAQINLKMHLLKQPKFSKVRFARALRALFGANWNNSANAGLKQ